MFHYFSRRNKSGNRGAAIFCLSGSSTFPVSVTSNSSFIGNIATTDGGALYLERCSLFFNGSALQDNEAVNGGAVRSLTSDLIEIIGSTLTKNSASSFGLPILLLFVSISFVSFPFDSFL